MPLTRKDIRNKKFNTTYLRAGYDEEEVDDFLEEAGQELDKLIETNEELRSQLAKILRERGPGPVDLTSPLSNVVEVSAAFTAGSFIIPFMKAFASKAGEDAYSGLKELLGNKSRRRKRSRKSAENISSDICIIRDKSTGTTLVAPLPLTEEAIRELSMLDSSLILGKTLVWTASTGRWLIG
jgi:DivIVA domain-containing protein